MYTKQLTVYIKNCVQPTNVCAGVVDRLGDPFDTRGGKQTVVSPEIETQKGPFRLPDFESRL